MVSFFKNLTQHQRVEIDSNFIITIILHPIYSMYCSENIKSLPRLQILLIFLQKRFTKDIILKLSDVPQFLIYKHFFNPKNLLKKVK